MNKAALESYRQSIIRAIDDSPDPGTRVNLTPETTADQFAQDTKRYEQVVFKTFVTAQQVSFMEAGRHTGDAWMADTDEDGVDDDDDGRLRDGRLVKVVWLELPMLRYLRGSSREGESFTPKRSQSLRLRSRIVSQRCAAKSFKVGARLGTGHVGVKIVLYL
ncbi:hypothetical protein L202_07701 [Cryptococcus amylolentus CBS 6039]|uniref:Uncharacterized protein n=1 Tax=Cryptococcus amylolentus CBS 6039 TaxID=1295533 RepID=A0A1E3HAF5_9TREE|nr:hypothetical protein L202_07701 [Cryptococcus amylolentus CBS 6039]ODN73135.1 hypothetical protein L202_07701 [Cryptococcus amylolentus CBS 6039]